jgi:periplasmic divalent cation tolerance protein
MTSEYLSVYTTLPDEESARRVARTIVEESLAACANRFPMASIYRWQGEIVDEAEWGLIFKTRRALYARLEKRLREIHPYQIPAIVAYAIVSGLPAYLEWIAAETQPPEA